MSAAAKPAATPSNNLLDFKFVPPGFPLHFAEQGGRHVRIVTI